MSKSLFPPLGGCNQFFPGSRILSDNPLFSPSISPTSLRSSGSSHFGSQIEDNPYASINETKGHISNTQILQTEQRALAKKITAIAEFISRVDKEQSQTLQIYHQELQALVPLLSINALSINTALAKAVDIHSLAEEIQKKAVAEMRRIAQEYAQTAIIRKIVLRRAFPKKHEILNQQIEGYLPQLIFNLVLTGLTKRTLFTIETNDTYTLKCRYRANQIQVVIKKFLSSGSYKTVDKVAILAGPNITGAPGPIFAYAKPLRWGTLADLEASRRKLAEEIRTTQEIFSRGVPNIVVMSEVPKESDPSRRLKGAAMELFNCPDLLALVQRSLRTRHPISHREKVRIIHQIALALQGIHSLGFQHGDFKPMNILVSRKRGSLHAALSDFGLCVPIGSVRTGIFGTLIYTPPEMWADEQTGWVTSSSIDTWALGIIIFELFHGTNKNPLQNHLNENFLQKPPKERGRYIEALQQQIMACLNPSSAIDQIIADLIKINPLDRATDEQTITRIQAILSQG